MSPKLTKTEITPAPAFTQAAQTRVQRRPRFEGSNICTWIGFKHVMYLVEEGILEHLRASNLVPRTLFEEHGLCVEIVDSNARILHALHMDDLVDVEVTPQQEDGIEELRYQVTIHVSRGGDPLKAVVARVAVLLRVDDSAPTRNQPVTPAPALADFTVARIERGGHYVTRESAEPGSRVNLATRASSGIQWVDPDDDVARQLRARYGESALVWKWHIPYPYCHYNDRLQHSGYLRLLEEAEDLFLATRGISIHTMLRDKRWIPVVPEARVEILEEAYMEEAIYIVYALEDVYKEYTYTHRMDCWVPRGGSLIQTASGRITHGYAVIDNRRDWSLVAFDPATLAAIKGAERA
jgi:acyl-CoA thioesterase FadM